MVCHGHGYVERQQVKRGTGWPGTAANTQTNIQAWSTGVAGVLAPLLEELYCSVSAVECHGTTEMLASP